MTRSGAAGSTPNSVTQGDPAAATPARPDVDASPKEASGEGWAAPVTSVGGMSRRAFFDQVVACLRTRLPPEWSGFRSRQYANLLKVHYGNEGVHYEVWVDARREQLEVGLHFEDGPVSTAAYLRHFDAVIVQVKHELGAEVDLERWTTSWGRIAQQYALMPLSPDLAERVADRLAAMIRTLEPHVRNAEVPAERGTATIEASRGRWRRRRARA